MRIKKKRCDLKILEMRDEGRTAHSRVPDVSIIIPVYNAERYLDDCISSAVNQTWDNLEIIMVDDGSNDRSLDICNKWTRRDQRIRLICQANGGPSSARNKGVRESLGKYILFLDADDTIRNDAVEKLLEVIGDNDFVVFGYTRIDEAGHMTPNGVMGCLSADCRSLEDYQKAILLGTAENYPINRLYTRKILSRMDGPFNECISMLEDLEFTRRLCSVARKIAVLPLPLYRYRVNWDSSSHSVNPKKAIEGLRVIKEDPWRGYLSELDPAERDIALNRIIGTLFMCYDLAAGPSEEAIEARKAILNAIEQVIRSGVSLGRVNWIKCLAVKTGLYNVARAVANKVAKFK